MLLISTSQNKMAQQRPVTVIHLLTSKSPAHNAAHSIRWNRAGRRRRAGRLSRTPAGSWRACAQRRAQIVGGPSWRRGAADGFVLARAWTGFHSCLGGRRVRNRSVEDPHSPRASVHSRRVCTHPTFIFALPIKPAPASRQSCPLLTRSIGVLWPQQLGGRTIQPNPRRAEHPAKATDDAKRRPRLRTGLGLGGGDSDSEAATANCSPGFLRPGGALGPASPPRPDAGVVRAGARRPPPEFPSPVADLPAGATPPGTWYDQAVHWRGLSESEPCFGGQACTRGEDGRAAAISVASLVGWE